MRSNFNFFSATAKWLDGILKTVFECVFGEMTDPKLQSIEQLYLYGIQGAGFTIQETWIQMQ